ncbi:MAG: T9SS type A sorting domain-containing protein [Bacteroidetes bacterium]|nr:T9SS type A sorting domain-containing protein [Bacteroidota bacterium]
MKDIVNFIFLFLFIGLLDVNAEVQTNPVIVKIDSVSVSNGAQVIVNVRVKNFQNIISAQGTISFDPAIATYSTISQFGITGMNINNFGLTQIASGKLLFSWNEANLNGVSLTDSSVLFSIKFDVVGGAGQQTLISLVNSPTTIEFADNNFNTVSVTTTSGKIIIPSGLPLSNLFLFADSLSGLIGSQVIMPIRVKQFNQMISAQGTVTFNHNIASFVSIEQIGLPGMTASDFGTTQITDGKLMFSWSDATLSGLTLADSSVIFAIKYTLVGNVGLQTAIAFASNPVAIEFVNTSLNTISVTAKSGVIKISSTPVPSNLTFKIDSVNGVNGGQVIIPIRVKDFINILSIQGSIMFDQTVASFVSVQQFGVNGMDANNFGTTLTSIGKLTFSWYDVSMVGQTLADSTIIFSMKFNLIGTPGSNTNISFSSNPVTIEFIHSNLNSIPVNLINGNIKLFGNISLATSSLTSNSLCAGQTISVPYTVSDVLANGNFFTTQLSDATGSFTNPLNIGILSSFASGIINAVIPSNTSVGSAYRIRVVSSNPSIVGSDNGFNLNINNLPAKPDLPTGSTSLCENNANTDFFIPLVYNALSYQWAILPANAGNISGNTTTASVDWSNTFSGNAKITVKAVNSCGNSLSSDTLLITINSLPLKPNIPSGLTSICQNAVNTNYSTSSVNSGGFMWSLTPSSAGIITGNTTTASVDWSDTYSGIAKISLKAINSCGNSVSSDSLTVTVNPLPIKPGTPSGSTILCENNLNSTYTTSGSANSASYSWSVYPSTAGTISGTTTSMTIDWNNTFTGSAKIIVKGVNTCGTGIASDTLTATLNPLPLKPVTPTGSSILCQGSTPTNYNTQGSTNATTYLWSIYPTTAGSISGTTTTASVTWNTIFTGTAKISVKGINTCGNSLSSDSLSVTVNSLPLKPSIPNGSTSLCENNINTNYTTSGSSYATSYQWSIYPGIAGNITGTTSTAVVDWSNTYTGISKISVIGINGCGNSISSDSLTVTINSLPTKPGIPSGSTVLCENNSNSTFTTSGSANSTSYSWSVYPSTAGTISGTTTSMTIDWNNTFTGIAKILVKGINACGTGIASDSLTVSLNPLPLKPSAPTGLGTLCQGSAATNYNTAGSTNATTYLWSIYPTTAGSISGTTATASVTWNTIFTGTAKISVKGINTCGNSLSSDSLSVTINPLPLKPTTPTGSTSLCENNANTNYTTTGSSNATSYQWSIYPTIAGSITGTTIAAVVDWSNTYTGISKISVIGINGCGNSVSSDSLTVTINSLPVKPGAPSGTTVLCENNSNSTYTTSGSINSTSYNWSVYPSTAGTISGTTTSMTIDWNNTFTGSAKIIVKGVNTCGTGIASDTLTATLNPLPLKPVTPTGSSILCQGSTPTNYNTQGSTNATTYLWSIYPTTAGSISSTTASASVTWNTIFIGTAKISVKGVNTCGNSLSSDSLSVTVNPLPLKPSTPTGSTSLCENNANTNYTTTGSSNATSYQWSIYPAIAGSITGTTTTAIVDWTDTYTGIAKITVIGINGCGNSISSDSLTVTINSLPIKPGTPTGPVNLSQNSPNSIYSTTGSSNATSYQWSISPTNAALISGATTSATFDWNNTFTGTAKISVIAINSCGNSLVSDSLTVMITAFPTADFQNIVDSICLGTSDTLKINLTGASPWAIVYNNGSSNLNINNINTTPYLLIVNPTISTTYKLISVTDVNWTNNQNDTSKVVIRSLPVASFTKAINVLNVNFTNTSTYTNSYSWDFGDSSPISNQINPLHTYSTFGNYLVNLTATNICGSDNYQDSVKLSNVGVFENTNSSQLIVYPNPNKGNFEIKINGIKTDFQLFLYNEIGQMIINEKYNFGGSSSFNKDFIMQEYPKGIYILNILTFDGIISKKIVIQ